MSTENTKEWLVAGIMTGNSLDALDIGIFKVTLAEKQVQKFEQIYFHSEECSTKLRSQVLELKEKLKASAGRIDRPLEAILAETSVLYHQSVNDALANARGAVRANAGRDVDLIGFHGQTLGHVPPSVARAEQKPYTIQLVNGGCIADVQKVVTVADFRSDDLLNGGEGAPFAPGFNALLALTLGAETTAFINAGNTSNIALIRRSTSEARGWDCGPCNQFPDLLMREEKGASIDTDGAIALRGEVKKELIDLLWAQAVVREDGVNALEIEGARSFDPQWYRLPGELRSSAEPFENRMRSVVAFSAYCIAHSLATGIHHGYRPEIVLLFGGGWKNQALLGEFKNICSGNVAYILPQHTQLFVSLSQALTNAGTVIKLSDELGLPSNGMEAGIFAFAAVQRLLNQPFTRPSFTNCRSPTRCGAVFVPKNGAISTSLVGMDLSDERHLFKDVRLARAAPVNQ